MTTNDPVRVDGTHVTEQKRAAEALTEALATEELDEKTTRFEKRSSYSY